MHDCVMRRCRGVSFDAELFRLESNGLDLGPASLGAVARQVVILRNHHCGRLYLQYSLSLPSRHYVLNVRKFGIRIDRHLPSLF
jgi:hypothetical protein